jgi:hypothetical protein
MVLGNQYVEYLREQGAGVGPRSVMTSVVGMHGSDLGLTAWDRSALREQQVGGREVEMAAWVWHVEQQSAEKERGGKGS